VGAYARQSPGRATTSAGRVRRAARAWVTGCASRSGTTTSRSASDAVPAAADARLLLAPDADLLVVVPERDAHPVTQALAARLTRPAEVVALPGDWRA